MSDEPNSLDQVDTDSLLDAYFPEDGFGSETGKVTNEEIFGQLAEQEDSDSVDTTTGAPFSVRAQVNATPRDDDRLATLKNFYPDALPVEARFKNGASKFGAGNFVYTDPDTGQLTLFDEDSRIFGFPYPSLTDLTADVGLEAAELTGGIYGGLKGAAIMGTAASPTVVGILPAIGTGWTVGEGLGSAAARDLYTLGFVALGETEDDRTSSERFIDFGSTAVLNAYGGQVLSKIADGVNFVAGRPIRYVTGAMSKAARETFETMQRAGVSEPTAGQVTGSPLYQLLEQSLSIIPSAAKTMHENASQTLSELTAQFNKIAAKVGGGGETPAGISQKLTTSLKAARARYRNERNGLYEKVNSFIDPNFRGGAQNTLKFITELEAKKGNAMDAGPVGPALQEAMKVAQVVGDGELTFNRLKEFRTQIRKIYKVAEKKNFGELLPEEELVKDLYTHLSNDLDEFVEAAAKNSPDAKATLSAYREANDFVLKNEATNTGPIDFISKVLKKGEFDSVDALREVFRNANVSPERIAKLKEKLTNEEFSELAGYALGNLGTARGRFVGEPLQMAEEIGMEGAEYVASKGFNYSAFLNNWQNQYSKETKELLFKDTEYEDLIPALDDLAFTVKRVQESAQAMANPSGTARLAHATSLFAVPSTMMYMGGDTGFVYGLATVGAPAFGSKLMTNPGFVKWLSGAVEKVAYDPQAFSQHVRRLAQIALVNPEIRDEVEGVLERLQGESQVPIPEKNSASVNEKMVPENNEANFREVSTREVSDKLLPTSEELMGQMDQVTVPQVEGPLFEETITETPDVNLAMSPTVLPRDDDRELALRLRGNAGGIGALV